MEINEIAKALRHASYIASPQGGIRPQQVGNGMPVMVSISSEQIQSDLIVRGILNALAYGFEQVCKEKTQSKIGD